MTIQEIDTKLQQAHKNMLDDRCYITVRLFEYWQSVFDEAWAELNEVVS